MADLAGHLRGDDPSEIIKFPPLSKLFEPVWNPDFDQVRLSLTADVLGSLLRPSETRWSGKTHGSTSHSQTGDGQKAPTLHPGSLYQINREDINLDH